MVDYEKTRQIEHWSVLSIVVTSATLQAQIHALANPVRRGARQRDTMEPNLFTALFKVVIKYQTRSNTGWPSMVLTCPIKDSLLDRETNLYSLNGGSVLTLKNKAQLNVADYENGPKSKCQGWCAFVLVEHFVNLQMKSQYLFEVLVWSYGWMNILETKVMAKPSIIRNPTVIDWG